MKTRQFSCVNARGIPPAARRVAIASACYSRYPPPPPGPEMGTPSDLRWGTPLPGWGPPVQGWIRTPPCPRLDWVPPRCETDWNYYLPPSFGWRAVTRRLLRTELEKKWDLLIQCSIVYYPPPPTHILTWHLPTYNILSGHLPLTIGAEAQLCWLLPLTLEPSA